MSIPLTTVDTLSPAVPDLLSPADGTVTSTNALTLRWQSSSSSGVAGYRLNWNGKVWDVDDVIQYPHRA